MYLHIKEEDLKKHKGDIEIFIDEYRIKSNINVKELSIVQDDLDDLTNPLWLNRPTKQIIVE